MAGRRRSRDGEVRRGWLLLECRTLGHAWDVVDIDHEYPNLPAGYDVLWFRCQRCDTTRHDVVDAWGELSSRAYGYPDDYRDAFGRDTTRAQFRRLIITAIQEGNR